MKDRTPLLLAFLLLLIGTVVAILDGEPRSAGNMNPPVSVGTEDDPHAQAEMEFMMLRDPVTNEIPRGIRQRERELARRLPTFDNARAMGLTRRSQALTWTERGPDDVGGRTRVFAGDITNPDVLLAGSVAGGMWKSINDGASWFPTTSPSQIHSTTCIAQDRRAGFTNVWYVGTGEFRGSTNNDTRWGSLYRGDGIFKSVDNGSSWALLPSTSSGTPQSTDAFDYIWNVATDPSNATEEEVYAATYIGIYRSTDGGTSWAQTHIADSSYTDVVVTNNGVVYAFTKSGGVPEIWRSPDGITWTNIVPIDFPTFVGRSVFASFESNPAVLYLFVQGADNFPAVNGHQLWKYTYISGDGSGSGGTWENRGGNLPGDLSTQTGYDMMVHVHPLNEDLVLIGGTNLYRATDGFASTGLTTTIGGYPFWPQGPHHPDLHSGFFRADNPNVYYSGHDGGVTKTGDVTAATVVWTGLNNGYNVTQFYSVSIAPEAGSNLILAGAQDNGTQMGNAPGVSSWVMAFGGDGTVVEVAPIAHDRLYTQYQNGQMQRMNRDLSNVFSITPSGATNQLFVNPIALDPNNASILYFAAGRSSPSLASAIWRNDNAPNATSTTGWTALTGTDVGFGTNRRISALGVSSANNANVLYYGTTDGIVKRADNANTATPTVTTITPPGLNGGTTSGGFVRSIAVDPENSNNALVAFGNYNFQSLWYTTNGGTSWTDVEGNLAGPSGPSTRFASMFHVNGERQVFLATSIGVLSTTALNGASTVWVQEGASEMGNIIVGYLDYRASDATIVAGTHSRGVFTAQFEVLPCTTISVHAGWNLISIPFFVENDTVQAIFPSSSFSYAIAYGPTGYSLDYTLEPGEAYWLRFPGPEEVTICGFPLGPFQVNVNAGWNMIGSGPTALTVDSVGQNPPGIVMSEYYRFTPSGYVIVDTLLPGYGYWVKASEAGELILDL